MKRIVAFMFISSAITTPQRNEMDLGQGLMITVGVNSYEMACLEAKKLSEEGAVLIDLCGGFGTIGHAMVTKAVQRKVQIGIVRYDNHPGYDFVSGDSKWL